MLAPVAALHRLPRGRCDAHPAFASATHGILQRAVHRHFNLDTLCAVLENRARRALIASATSMTGEAILEYLCRGFVILPSVIFAIWRARRRCILKKS
jgi:hypothetical protein